MQRNGKLPHPTANVLEMPAINPEVRATILETPAGTPEVRATHLETPATTPKTPADTLETPADTLEMRATDPETPAGNPEVRATILAMPAAETLASARPSKRARGVYQVKGSIEQRLMVAKVAIEAVLNDPMLQELLTPYGYALAEMRQGQALRTQALALVQQRHARVGKQLAATDSHAKTQAQAHSIYKRHVAFARLAFRDDRDAATALDLSARKGTLAGWVLQAQQFYTNALPDQAITAKLARYGVTKEQLLAAQALVEAVASSMVTRQTRTASAKEAKQARDAALKALDRWMLDFIAVVRIALAEQPHRLAQLGLVRG